VAEGLSIAELSTPPTVAAMEDTLLGVDWLCRWRLYMIFGGGILGLVIFVLVVVFIVRAL
jgi:hypothetical protein